MKNLTVNIQQVNPQPQDQDSCVVTNCLFTIS